MGDSYQAALEAQPAENDAAALAGAGEVAAGPLKARMEREMTELHQNVESLLPNSKNRVLQFISCRAGEGVSTVVREYALMAATRLGQSVLIMDANDNVSGQRHFFQIAKRCGWDDALRAQATLEAAATRIGHSSIYVSCASSLQDTAKSCDGDSIREFLDRVKGRFDLALIDSPSLATGLDTATVTRCVDGVVMVVEAEKTRWPVVLKAKRKMMNNGAPLLGLVFNKRRNYIPEFIYTRL